jgi:hypothetical protein
MEQSNKENQGNENVILQNQIPTAGVNSAFIPDNPDFNPSKDVPQARGCAPMIEIIGTNWG